ncbi:MAG TPA: phospholipase D-like domain-containing protein [Solirubrobacteraceae bacterium]|nr:phospholipase D-like domain-containing protein [Solirubrobacteraceae bacterium]
MTLHLAVYNNGDHAALAWLPDGPKIPDCRGFALKRSRGGQADYLHNFLGFSPTDVFPADAPWKWPIQRYLWWDYGVAPGDVVKYQVIPVTGAANALAQRPDLASDWSPELTISSQFTPHISAYFNKGVVAAQWVARALQQEDPQETQRKALLEIIAKPGDPLRDALGALLKGEVLSLLKNAPGDVFAALYELNDPELISALKTLGERANLVLANGAFSSQKPDENAAVRADLDATKTVSVSDRMVSEGHFAHNKFAVFCDEAKAAQTVLTGSTNWTMSGLCTQANNGLLIDDHAVADRFLTQWHALQQAENAFPASLIAANSQQQQFVVDDVTVTPWFAPTSAQQDLQYARNLIANAQHAALFLFFNPGTYSDDPMKETLLQDILERRDSGLYIRGVVNQEIAQVTDDPPPSGAPVTLIGTQDETPLSTDVLVPANIKSKIGNFDPEPLGASPVMVHSKVVVLDPWGDHPVLMTGSHNLGVKASKANDDNLVILEGQAATALASAYAVNIIAIFQAYRWNHYATTQPGGWHGPEDNDTWQDGHLTGESLTELRFWTQQPAPAAAPAG